MANEKYRYGLRKTVTKHLKQELSSFVIVLPAITPTKLFEALPPALKGLSDVLLNSRGENKAFPAAPPPPPPLQHCAAVTATFRKQKTPQL